MNAQKSNSYTLYLKEDHQQFLKHIGMRKTFRGLDRPLVLSPSIVDAHVLCRRLSSHVQHVYLLVDLKCRNESFVD